MYTVAPGHKIFVMQIAADGTLDALASHTYTVGTNVAEMAIDPSGVYMYIPSIATQEVLIMQISSDGRLTKLDANTIPLTGFSPTGVNVYSQNIPW